MVQLNVRAALAEDVGSGDITAALIAPEVRATGRVISREYGVLCGQAWVDAVFAALDETVSVNWHRQDGQTVNPDDTCLPLRGRLEVYSPVSAVPSTFCSCCRAQQQSVVAMQTCQ